MIFKQFRYELLGQASYLLGCMRARDAFIVDPIADLGPDFYLLEAADLGLSIAGVLETHIHADYISCARELAETCGCAHYLGEAATGLVRYEFTPLADGQALRLGQLEVRAVATPGHTPEHVAYLVTDAARATDPWLVLTGDSLLVGDVGRPDLQVGDTEFDVMDEAQRAEVQWRSIHERLFTLPEHVEIYPSHYGGSTCGGVNMSGKASSTIWFEKHHNRALAQVNPPDFAAFVRETARPFPQQHERIKSINLGLRESELVR
jgi:glyoxylase-like metal-dependent hydrolase (beta-lactamase superfamily II)